MTGASKVGGRVTLGLLYYGERAARSAQARVATG